MLAAVSSRSGIVVGAAQRRSLCGRTSHEDDWKVTPRVDLNRLQFAPDATVSIVAGSIPTCAGDTLVNPCPRQSKSGEGAPLSSGAADMYK